MNIHATIPKGNMGYDQYTVPDTVAVDPTFLRSLVPFLQIPFKISELNTAHNPFRIDACTFSDNLSRNSCM